LPVVRDCLLSILSYIQLLAYQDAVLSDWNQRKRQAVINHVRTHRHTKANAIFVLARSQNCEKRLLVRHVCPSVRPYGTTRPHLTDLHTILYFRISRKSVDKIQVSFKSDKNK
jgi:hypothetical protein